MIFPKSQSKSVALGNHSSRWLFMKYRINHILIENFLCAKQNTRHWRHIQGEWDRAPGFEKRTDYWRKSKRKSNYPKTSSSSVLVVSLSLICILSVSSTVSDLSKNAEVPKFSWFKGMWCPSCLSNLLLMPLHWKKYLTIPLIK